MITDPELKELYDRDWSDPKNWHSAANIYPLMSEDEIDKLSTDIAQNGLNSPIVLIREDGTVKLLDGRNRALALKQLADDDLEDADFTYWVPSPYHSPVSYAVSQNSQRRHLTKDQLTIVAAKIAIAFEEESKRKSLANLKRGSKKPDIAIWQPREEPSVVKASKAINNAVSPRQVSRGVKIVKEDPETAEKVAAGKMKVSQAKKVVRAKAVSKEVTPTFSPATITLDAGIVKQLTELNERHQMGKTIQDIAIHLIMDAWWNMYRALGEADAACDYLNKTEKKDAAAPAAAIEESPCPSGKKKYESIEELREVFPGQSLSPFNCRKCGGIHLNKRGDHVPPVTAATDSAALTITESGHKQTTMKRKGDTYTCPVCNFGLKFKKDILPDRQPLYCLGNKKVGALEGVCMLLEHAEEIESAITEPVPVPIGLTLKQPAPVLASDKP